MKRNPMGGIMTFDFPAATTNAQLADAIAALEFHVEPRWKIAVVLTRNQRDMIVRALRSAGARRVPEPPAHAIRNYEFGG